MTLLSFCGRCMPDAAKNTDQTPHPGCPTCRGEGYVPATAAEKRAYWAVVSHETPRR